MSQSTDSIRDGVVQDTWLFVLYSGYCTKSLVLVPKQHMKYAKCGKHQVLISGWFLSCSVVTHACTTFCRTYCAPLQISPKKIEKHAFYIDTLRRKNETDLVQNRSVEFEIERLDRFCCPIALTIAVQNPCAVHLSNLFWKVNSWNAMEFPRLYLFVLGKYHDLGPNRISPSKCYDPFSSEL